jgi:transposase InsO family protein
VRKARDGQRRHLSDDALLVHIKAIHAESGGSYGWPRMWKELLARGIRVGKDRVQKLMQRHGAYFGQRDHPFRSIVTEVPSAEVGVISAT